MTQQKITEEETIQHWMGLPQGLLFRASQLKHVIKHEEKTHIK